LQEFLSSLPENCARDLINHRKVAQVTIRVEEIPGHQSGKGQFLSFSITERYIPDEDFTLQPQYQLSSLPAEAIRSR
jgi:hypothetical protein